MATLLDGATSNSNPASATGTATGASSVLIEIPNDSVFDGAQVILEGSSVNTAGLFSGLDRIAALTAAGHVRLELTTGHFVRALLVNAGANTSVTVEMHDVA